MQMKNAEGLLEIISFLFYYLFIDWYTSWVFNQIWQLSPFKGEAKTQRVSGEMVMKWIIKKSCEEITLEQTSAWHKRKKKRFVNGEAEVRLTY